jgi:putative flippase GtrA
MLRRINESLPGLIVGIVLYGVIVRFVGVWFVKDVWAYSIGLWYGIAIAIGMGINMAFVIYDTVTFYGEHDANKRVAAKAILRYVVVVILFGILGYFQFGDIIAAFLGAMGLKISAYMQPLLAKLTKRITGKENVVFYMGSTAEENSENLDEEVTM